MENLSLYKITNRFMDLFVKAESEELTAEEIQEQGNELAVILQSKSENIIGYAKNIDYTTDAVDNEIERLTNIKKALKNRKDKYYEYVKGCMETLSLEKIETPIGNITIAKNPMSVEIVDETLVPDMYKITKVTTTVDKTAIKNDFKATGELIAGTQIIDNKTNLRIK